MNECCKGCWKWETYGEKCWVHWDNKKICTHFSSSAEDELKLE